MPRLNRLTTGLARLTARRHGRAALEAALADPHLARDLGLPYRPLPRVDLPRW